LAVRAERFVFGVSENPANEIQQALLRGMNKTQHGTKAPATSHIISSGPSPANTCCSCKDRKSSCIIRSTNNLSQELFSKTTKLLVLVSTSFLYLPALADISVKSVITPVYRNAYNPETQSWGQDSPLKSGLRLHGKDRLKRKFPGMALISCPSGSQLHQSDDLIEAATFCKTVRAATGKGFPGAQDNPSVPYLLEPRIGFVRGQTPTVRWKHVDGVKKYIVSVYRRGDEAPLSDPIGVNTSHAKLPANLNLKAGEEYHLVVETDKGNSSKEEIFSDSLKFGVLSIAEDQALKQELQKQIESLRAEGIAPLELVPFEVFYLEQRDLIAEAFALLSRLESKQETLQGQLDLGRLASRQGLNTQAMIYFRKAAALASNAGDSERVSEAREGEKQARRLAEEARPSTTPAP
jgi:hypothetical protein